MQHETAAPAAPSTLEYLHRCAASWRRPRFLAAVLAAEIVTSSPHAPELEHFDLIGSVALDDTPDGRYFAARVTPDTAREHNWHQFYLQARRAA